MISQLSPLQNKIFLLGAVLMTVGAGLTLVSMDIASWTFAVGAVCFSSMQMQIRATDERASATIKRLVRLLRLCSMMFLVSAVLMFLGNDNPLRLDHIFYLTYIRQKWVAALLLAALLQLYLTHRIQSEEEKGSH